MNIRSGDVLGGRRRSHTAGANARAHAFLSADRAISPFCRRVSMRTAAICDGNGRRGSARARGFCGFSTTTLRRRSARAPIAAVFCKRRTSDDGRKAARQRDAHVSAIFSPLSPRIRQSQFPSAVATARVTFALARARACSRRSFARSFDAGARARCAIRPFAAHRRKSQRSSSPPPPQSRIKMSRCERGRASAQSALIVPTPLKLENDRMQRVDAWR